MPKPSRNEIYEAVIRKMVTQALEHQELTFTQEHAMDSDEQLLEYIREQGRCLCHTPRKMEIVGWQLLERRFGSWNMAIKLAGLDQPGKCQVSKLPRIQEELKRQKKIYRQNKAEKKLKHQQRVKEQNLKKSK